MKDHELLRSIEDILSELDAHEHGYESTYTERHAQETQRPEREAHPRRTINIYVEVDDGQQVDDDLSMVDGTLEERQEAHDLAATDACGASEDQEHPASARLDTPDTVETSQHPVAPRAVKRRRARRFPIMLLLALLALAGCLVGLAYAIVEPTLAPSATVTIIPTVVPITTDTTLTVVPSTPTTTSHQLSGRLLSSVTMSQAHTVPTTGTAHQDAKAAQGFITFYNSSLFVQTVTAGTILTGADGVQVVTDTDAVIPAGQLTTNGQRTVSSHAVIVGPGGNIQAGDIYGPCCRVNVFAANTAFTGGQAARTYPTVTQQDINAVVSMLKTSLDQSVQAAFQTQVHPDETLLTPLPCQQSITPDHHVGEETAQVQVTVDETCTGMVYNTQAYRDRVAHILSQEATKRLGEGYIQLSDIQASTTNTTQKEHGTVDLEVKGAGMWGYQFQSDQVQHLKAVIAGKNEAQAKALLLQIPGVKTVSLSVKNGTHLPTDTNTIHIIVLEMV